MATLVALRLGGVLRATLGRRNVNATGLIGLVVLLGGVILQPVGWMYSQWIGPVSLAAIVVGVLLVLKGRKDWGLSNVGSGGGSTGRDLPGDVHGYSGQLSGGRSTALESSHSSSGDSSDGSGSSD